MRTPHEKAAAGLRSATALTHYSRGDDLRDCSNPGLEELRKNCIYDPTAITMVALGSRHCEDGSGRDQAGGDESSRASQRSCPHAEKIDTRTSRRLRHCLHMTIWTFGRSRKMTLGVDSDRRLLQVGVDPTLGART